jgi:hypothetical protein
MLRLYVFICLVVAVFVFLDTHTNGDGVGVTFIELLISLPWANALVMWVIMFFIYSAISLALTLCEDFIKYVKGENNEKEDL